MVETGRDTVVAMLFDLVHLACLGQYSVDLPRRGSSDVNDAHCDSGALG